MSTTSIHRRADRWVYRVLLAACGSLLLGCESEDRVIKYTTFFDHLPGAVHGMEPVNPNSPRAATAAEVAMSEDQLVEKDERGNVTLRARAIRHVMVHITRTLADGEDDLLLNQVFSERTRQRFRTEGRDAREGVEFLKEHRDDIMAMFARMPAAENSASTLLDTMERNVFRLRLVGTAAKNMRFTELWVVVEKNEWKLYWIR